MRHDQTMPRAAARKRNRRKRNAAPASAPRIVRCRPESQAAWEAAQRGEDVVSLEGEELDRYIETGELPARVAHWLGRRK
jgi:hypothetical protein